MQGVGRGTGREGVQGVGRGTGREGVQGVGRGTGREGLQGVGRGTGREGLQGVGRGTGRGRGRPYPQQEPAHAAPGAVGARRKGGRADNPLPSHPMQAIA